MSGVRFSITVMVFAVLMGTMLLGCNSAPKEAGSSGLAEQQKGIMGGTPPPSEQAKINAMMADQARKSAEGQAAAAKAAQSGK